MFRSASKSLNRLAILSSKRLNSSLTDTFHSTRQSHRSLYIASGILTTLGLLALYSLPNQKLFADAESMITAIEMDQSDDSDMITQVSLDYDSVEESKKHISVFVFGSNTSKLIDPESREIYLRNPTSIDFFKGKVLRDLVLSDEYAVAVDKNGDVFEWGVGFKDTKEPQLVLKNRNIKQVVCTATDIYLLSMTGILYSIKSRALEQDALMQARLEKLKPSYFNYKNYTQSKEEQCLDKIYFDTNIKKIVGGNSHLIALTSNGQLKGLSTGETGNLYGQLGQDNTTPCTKIVSIPTFSKVTDVVCGSNHTIFTTEDEKIHGFGSNAYGQLATGAIGEIPAVLPIPTEIQTIWTRFSKAPPPAGTTCVKIAAGGDTSYFAIQGATGNEVVSCGYGVNAQLGNGSYFHMQPHPVKIKRLSDHSEWCDATKSVQQIGVHDLQSSTTHSVAVLSNSRSVGFGRDVFVWGLNTRGQLNRMDEKKMVAATPVWGAALGYGGKKASGRLSMTPEFKIDGVKVEQKIVCGPGITAVYMKVVQ